MKHIVVAIVALVCVVTHANLNPQLMSTISVKNIAITSTVATWPGSDSPALLTTTYAAFGKTPVSYISDLKALSSTQKSPQVDLITEDLLWTNYIDAAPAEIGAHVVATAGGFLVPGRQTGTIDLFDMSDPSTPIQTKVSTDKKGWFYHKLVWYDMNGDGKLDIVAARATVPMSPFAKPAGELIWLEQPSSGSIINNGTSTDATAWNEHVVVAGPDVDFIMEDLDGDGTAEVIATQFFSAEILAIYKCAETTWSKCGNDTVSRIVIDDKVGPFFTVKRVDLNMDGTPDLLVTNNQADGTGALFAFEQPADINDKWTRRTLASGFKPYPSIIPSPGKHSKGSPGTALAFHIETSKKGEEKPQILMSGDDGGFISLLRPTSSVATDWEYSNEYICNSTGTMGQPSFIDIDGDGLTEIFLPFYSEGKIEVYNFTTAPSTPIKSECVICLAKEASEFCYKDNQCHVVGSPYNPCSVQECTSTWSKSTKCACTSCNDAACHA